MAMVISQTTKAAIGGILALMILGAVLVVGAALGWFDPKREDEDTPAKISARLQGRTSFVTHRAVSYFFDIFYVKTLIDDFECKYFLIYSNKIFPGS